MRRATITDLHSGRNAALCDTDTTATDTTARDAGAQRVAAWRVLRSWGTWRGAPYGALCCASATMDEMTRDAVKTAALRSVLYRRATLRCVTIGAVLRPSAPHSASQRPVRMTRAERYGVAVLVDDATRQTPALIAERVARLTLYRPDAAAVAARINHSAAAYDAAPWRGLVSAREARAAERGRGALYSASAAAVSVRDAHGAEQHAPLLRQARTVGVATHPLTDKAQRDALLHAALCDTRRATVLVLRPCPHGLRRVAVVPADEYSALRDARRDAERANAPRPMSVSEARHMRAVRQHARIGVADPTAHSA